MKTHYRNFVFALTLVLGFLSPDLKAQQVDSLKKYQATDTLKKYQTPDTAVAQKKSFFKSKGFKATIVPAVLIGYGLSTIKGNGIYSSYDAQRDIMRRNKDFDSPLDDIFLIAPYVELVVANLVGQHSNNDLLNTTLVILKAELINTAIVYGLKGTTNQLRPNGQDRESMPSGHTAQAFLAASILHTELKHKSQWYGVGAYAIATSVGAMRMLKNKHWQSDVFVGAGIGILSSHVAYLTHRNRWGRKPSFAIAPTYIYGTPGFGLAFNLDQHQKNKKVSKYASTEYLKMVN